jgi:hypothetical protein
MSKRGGSTFLTYGMSADGFGFMMAGKPTDGNVIFIN